MCQTCRGLCRIVVIESADEAAEVLHNLYWRLKVGAIKKIEGSLPFDLDQPMHCIMRCRDCPQHFEFEFANGHGKFGPIAEPVNPPAPIPDAPTESN